MEVAPAASPLLEVRDLGHRYDDGTEALAGVSLRLERGERLGVIGPNGAGKTTLLFHLNGLLTPSRGEVRLAGRSLRDPGAIAEARRQVGMLFQDPDDMLFTTRVRDEVAFGPLQLGLGEAEAGRRVAMALEALGLEALADRVPFQLSKGRRQEVALAAVLAMEPQVIALDEPSASLDARARRRLIELLRALPAALVIASHDLDLVGEVCGRAVVLEEGRVVAEGGAPALLADDALLRRYGLRA